MSIPYETLYGVSFGGKHSFREYGLLPLSKPVISPPAVKTYYVEVPGADGSIDLTEALTGYVTYGDRTGKFDYQLYAPKDEWLNVYNQIVSDLHGKAMDVVLDDDDKYYYHGRLSVGSLNVDKNKAKIQITGTFKSGRYAFDTTSGNDWLWNPFDFESDVAREYYQIRVKGEKQVTLIGSDLVVNPVFTLVSGAVGIKYNGGQYNLHSGDNAFANIVLTSTGVTVTLFGNGSVTISYKIGGGD